MLRFAQCALSLFLLTMIAACGQKGALYLPGEEQEPGEVSSQTQESLPEQSQSEPSLDN
jgi:predicted small lipoprotein YifL